MGHLFQETAAGHIVLTFNVTKLRKERETIGKVALELSTETNSGEIKRLLLEQAVDDVYLDREMGLFEVVERRARGVGEWIGGILGLANQWQLHKLEAKEAGSQAAIKTMMHEVEAIRELQKEEVAAIRAIQTDDNERQAIWNVKLRMTTDSVKVRSVGQVINMLPRHRLAPEAEDLVDLKAAWTTFRETLEDGGWTMAVEHLQHLYSMDVSYSGTAEGFVVVIHIPIRRTAERPLQLVKLTAIPFMSGGQLMRWPTMEEVIVAQAVGQEEHIQLTSGDLERCNQVDRTWYCYHSHVRRGGRQHDCLEALQSGDGKTAAARCSTETTEAALEAWRWNDTAFMLAAPQETRLIISCYGKTATLEAVSGYVLAEVGRDCTARTEDGQLELVARVVDPAAVQAAAIWSDGKTVTGKIERPTLKAKEVESMVDKITAELEAGDDNILEWVAIGVAALGIMLIVVFVAVAYRQYRSKMKIAEDIA